MMLKQVRWVGDAQQQIQAFPDEPRREAGYQLARVQAGKEPADWKPVPWVGLGVNEIRVRIELARRRFRELIQERMQR